MLQVLCESPWPMTRHALAELIPCPDGAAAKTIRRLNARSLVWWMNVEGHPNGKQTEFTRLWRIRPEVRRLLYGS